jgi:Holliday junction resolvasome RuvABC endonuclease subunit
MKRRIVLGIHPFTRGFGWVVFEAPNELLDWGVVAKRKERNVRCRKAIGRLIDQYEPDLVALEDWRRLRRAKRIQALYQQIGSLCAERRVRCCKASPTSIRKSLTLDPAANRHAVASAIAARIEAIRDRLPRPRTPWDNEHPNMALFNAAAAALAMLMRQKPSAPATPGAPDQ